MDGAYIAIANVQILSLLDSILDLPRIDWKPTEFTGAEKKTQIFLALKVSASAIKKINWPCDDWSDSACSIEGYLFGEINKSNIKIIFQVLAICPLIWPPEFKMANHIISIWFI